MRLTVSNLNRWCWLSLAFLVLTACHYSDSHRLNAEGATPTLALQSLLGDVKHAQFDALLWHALPPEDYAYLRANWSSLQSSWWQSDGGKTAKAWLTKMVRYSLPCSDKSLYQRIEPVLDRWGKKGKKNFDMTVGVMKVIGLSQIAHASVLDGAQKARAYQGLDTFVDWLLRTDWGDKHKAEKALDQVAAALQGFQLGHKPETIGSRPYAQFMANSERVWRASFDVLPLYGIPLNEVFNTLSFQLLSKKGDHAVVGAYYTFNGRQHKSRLAMVRKGQRWYLQWVWQAWQKYGRNK